LLLTRVAVLGDVHAEHEHLEAALRRVYGKFDAILCVGDIVDGPGDINRTCQLLQEYEVQAVKGNHERWLFSNEMRVLQDSHYLDDIETAHRNWLQALPKTMRFETPQGPLLLCHGLGENDMKTLLPDETGYALQNNTALENLLYGTDLRYVVKGHSHRRMVRRIDDVTFINAGTLHRNCDPCFCTIDFGKREVQFFFFRNNQVVDGATQELL